MKEIILSKKIFLFIVLVLVFTCGYSQSVKLDTLYYDNAGKGISSPAFASFYRIYEEPGDPGIKMRMRDYYITGEPRVDGYYIFIDKYDDSKTIYDGERITYYKSGVVADKRTFVNGVEEGEVTTYYENGLIQSHMIMQNGKLNGILTEFNEQGDKCSKTEMKDGEPAYDFYYLSTNDGFSGKVRISDQSVIYESPSLSEQKVDYKDGAPWAYYIKNGITVAMTNTLIKDYGKWFQISLIITNNSLEPIEFDIDDITSTIIKKNGENAELEVWSSDQYMKKVRRSQNLSMALAGAALGLAASGAAYSSSTTTSYTTYNGGGLSNGSFLTTSTTKTYNGAAAYQANMIAINSLANYEDFAQQERTIKQEGYLKRTTIYPGEAISGYVNIKRERGSSMTVYISINGAIYQFTWDI